MPERHLSPFHLSCLALLALLPLAAAPANAAGQLLDGDAGFELSTPDGTFPDGGSWTPFTAGGDAGAVCTTTAASSGANGLWAYTGVAASDWWTGPYQEVPAAEGDSFRGTLWIRTPSGESWVAGSRALARIQFVNASGQVLASVESPAVEAASTAWAMYEATTGVAPAGTAAARFLCWLGKPAAAAGQSVANFDDAYLENIVLPPAIDVGPVVAGIGESATSVTLEVRNVGGGALAWSVTPDQGWLSIAPSSGDLVGSTTVTVTADKSGLTQGTTCTASLSFTSDGGDVAVPVICRVGPYAVPTGPSHVFFDGYRLLVQKRLSNGSLDAARRWPIKGVVWSPASIGTPDTTAAKRAEFLKWYVADAARMKTMGVNTVRVFIDFGTGTEATEILDHLYLNDIMVIMCADESNNNTARIAAVVSALKDHPAILFWGLGNEWPVNCYYGKFATIHDAAIATQQAALTVSALDAEHPVVSILGDPSLAGDTESDEIVNTLCPAVDAWGANVYRGPSFGPLFAEWSALTQTSVKPIFLSEFGTDSFSTLSYTPVVVGYEDEGMQAGFDSGLWDETAANLSCDEPANVCLGGSVFAFVDEWYKVSVADGGSPDVHDTGGYFAAWNPGAHPDSFSNEEFYGILDIDRRPKTAALFFQDDFAALSVAANDPPVVTSEAWASPGTVNLGDTVSLSVAAYDPDAGPSALAYRWEAVDPPGTVSFSPNATTDADTTAAGFVQEGVYTIRVHVSDSLDEAVSEVAVDVRSPSTVQFESEQFFVPETGAFATVTVTRTGGTNRAISVEYATSDGTAAAGAGGDYVASGGVLSWPDGDMAPKTFAVQINDDDAVEGDEFINLALTNPSAGAVLGAASAAELVIGDDDEAASERGGCGRPWAIDRESPGVFPGALSCLVMALALLYRRKATRAVGR